MSKLATSIDIAGNLMMSIVAKHPEGMYRDYKWSIFRPAGQKYGGAFIISCLKKKMLRNRLKMGVKLTFQRS